MDQMQVDLTGLEEEYNLIFFEDELLLKKYEQHESKTLQISRRKIYVIVLFRTEKSR